MISLEEMDRTVHKELFMRSRAKRGETMLKEQKVRSEEDKTMRLMRFG
jgi:hypothetical protein